MSGKTTGRSDGGEHAEEDFSLLLFFHKLFKGGRENGAILIGTSGWRGVAAWSVLVILLLLVVGCRMCPQYQLEGFHGTVLVGLGSRASPKIFFGTRRSLPHHDEASGRTHGQMVSLMPCRKSGDGRGRSVRYTATHLLTLSRLFTWRNRPLPSPPAPAGHHQLSLRERRRRGTSSKKSLRCLPSRFTTCQCGLTTTTTTATTKVERRRALSS